MGKMECKQCGKPCTNGLCEACQGVQPVLEDPAAEKPVFARPKEQPARTTSPTDTILIPVTPKSREAAPEAPVSAEISPEPPEKAALPAKSRKYLYPLLGLVGVAVLVLAGVLWYRHGQPENGALGTSSMQSAVTLSAADSYQIQIIGEDVKVSPDSETPSDSATSSDSVAAVDSAASLQAGDPYDWGDEINADRLDMKAFTEDMHFGQWEFSTKVMEDSKEKTHSFSLTMEETLLPDTLLFTLRPDWPSYDVGIATFLRYDNSQNTYAVTFDSYTLYLCFCNKGIYFRLYQEEKLFQKSNAPMFLEYHTVSPEDWVYSGTVAITTGYLNLREQPVMEANVITKLKNNQRLEIIKQDGEDYSFYEVYCYDEQKGFCHGYVARQYVKLNYYCTTYQLY